MSALIGDNFQGSVHLDDRRITRIREQFALTSYMPTMNPFLKQDYRTQFWPGGTLGLLSDSDVGIGLKTEWWELPEAIIGGGCSSRYGFTGVTRDKYGSIVGGCTVELFLTAANGNYPADSLVYTTVSDATTGAFTVLTSFYPDTHWLRAYKTGTPDAFATSVNTLIAG